MEAASLPLAASGFLSQSPAAACFSQGNLSCIRAALQALEAHEASKPPRPSPRCNAVAEFKAAPDPVAALTRFEDVLQMQDCNIILRHYGDTRSWDELSKAQCPQTPSAPPFFSAEMHQGKTFCTEYEKSKVLADRIALQAAAEGVPITIVYPRVIYGPGKLTTGNLVSRILIERFNGRLPGYIGDGYDRESFCHVDDVVSGHIAAMEKGRVGERYLLTGENKSFMQIFDMAANITNTKAPSFHVPLWLIEIYGWISVFVSRITGNLPLISYPVCPVSVRS